MEQTILLVIQVISAFALIGLILVQHGKGADAGASFGGGASQTVFGSSGSGNFLTKSTNVLAMIFFATSLLLAYFTKQAISTEAGSTLFDKVVTETELPAVTPGAFDITSDGEDLPVFEANVPSEGQAEELNVVEAANDIVEEAIKDGSAAEAESLIQKSVEELPNP